MRLLILLLMLLNILTFAWAQWGQPQPQPAPAELNPENIRIVREADSFAPHAAVNISAHQAVMDDTPKANKAVNVTTQAVVPVPDTATPAKIAIQSVCLEWGPLTINRVQDAQIRLNRLKLGNRLAAMDATTPGGPYWVYYPALKTKQDADNKLAEFLAKGVKDISVVRDGKWQNTISMGLYSKEAIANARVESLKQQGVAAQVEARGRAARIFTLSNLSPDEQDELKKIQAEFGGPALRKTTCRTL